MVVRVVGVVMVLLTGVVLLWSSEGDQAKTSNKKDETAKTKVESSERSADKAAATVPDRKAEEDDAEKLSPDEQAIRHIVRQVEEAFNKHDTKALTALFSSHGEIIDAGGEIQQGHEAITELFQGVFERTPEAQMTIQIESIRVLGSAVAIEEGLTRMVPSPGEPEELGRYAVVYSKEGNDWKMISARDLPMEAANDDHLGQLAWLIGDWIDECEECVVSTTYRRSDNEQFIVGQFHVDTTEEGTLDGTVHIGWDPQIKQLRSWVFDSEGGFATGQWARNEDTWIVKLNGVLADGRTTTSTYRMKRLSGDQAEVESCDRVIGGVLISDGEPVTIVRRGPAPESISEND